MKLTNTASRHTEDVAPLNPPTMSLYSCGPTVYDYVHIGNLRTFLLTDLLRRVLVANGYTIKHVMNITDVGHLVSDSDAGEDKLEKGARREGKTAWDVAKLYTEAFFADAALVNIDFSQTIIAKATEYIPQQIALIQQLEAKEVTYTTSDGVYFDSSTFADYGKMAHIDIAGLQSGARVQENPEKRHVTDFALWKFSPSGEQRAMEWESPWGVGFPGWHIECSAMALNLLGDTIDIHTGGVDLMPTHHTNEIAQSESATGKPFVRVWLHGEHLLVAGGKMSKSAGTGYRITELVARGYNPLAFRYLVLGAHYRSKLNFTWAALDGASRALNSLVWQASQWIEPGQVHQDYWQRFLAAVSDDLNLAAGLAVLWELVKSDCDSSQKAATVLEMDKVLGLQIAEQVRDWRDRVAAAGADLHDLLQQRKVARAAKDYNTADLIRDQILAAGFIVEDDGADQILRPMVITAWLHEVD